MVGLVTSIRTLLSRSRVKVRRPGLPAVHPAFLLFHLGLHTRVKNEELIRAGTASVFLGDNTILCRVLGRYKMYVDTRDNSISSHLMIDGFWEMWTTEAINQLVKPGMVVADIGANLGYFTMLMSDLVGPTGRVHAFEPNPEMASRLRRSLFVNGFTQRTQLHQELLGRTAGEEMAFHVLENEPGGGHMRPVTDADRGVWQILPTHRLDSRPDWREIEFAKIDVEGAEEAIWDGAEEMLRAGTLKIILMEFVLSRYGDPGAFIDRILSHGFSLEVVLPASGIKPTSRARLLDGSLPDDVMLLLRR